MSRRPLKHTELITLDTKDEQYLKTFLVDPVQEIAQKLFGLRRWLKFRDVFTVFARFGYFAQTSLSGIPTLGEEFCEAKPNGMTSLTNLLNMILSCGINYPKNIPKPFINLMEQVHIITFNIFSDHFKFSKRITNLSYTTETLFPPPSKKIDYIYKAIGCMTLIKLVLELSYGDRDIFSEKTELGIDYSQVSKLRDRTADPSMMCPLCCEVRQEPTSTECGHIFCWFCIHKWLKDRSECPICRKPTEPSRLIHLINYR